MVKKGGRGNFGCIPACMVKVIGELQRWLPNGHHSKAKNDAEGLSQALEYASILVDLELRRMAFSFYTDWEKVSKSNQSRSHGR